MALRSLMRGLAGSMLGAVLGGAPGAQATTRAFVVVYDGWGTPTSFSVSGRVLEDQDEKAPHEDTGGAENLVENMKALESDEVRGAEVRVSVGGQTYTATTDEDGVFQIRVKNLPATQALAPGASPVIARVTGPAHVEAREGTGSVWIHDASPGMIAVVSDIDDTIVKTYVTEKLKMAEAVLLRNARQLEPVEGAAANYRKARDAGVGAFFYLSGSPQNFYTRLRTYLDKHEFPRGPLLLKNLGADPITQQEGYKQRRLEALLHEFPEARLLLVGDSGEKDPEIYAAVRRKFPDRVIGIVIRKTPNSVGGPARFNGMTVVDDRYDTDDVLARVLADVPARVPARGPDAPTPAR